MSNNGGKVKAITFEEYHRGGGPPDRDPGLIEKFEMAVRRKALSLIKDEINATDTLATTPKEHVDMRQKYSLLQNLFKRISTDPAFSATLEAAKVITSFYLSGRVLRNNMV